MRHIFISAPAPWHGRAINSRNTEIGLPLDGMSELDKARCDISKSGRCSLLSCNARDCIVVTPLHLAHKRLEQIRTSAGKAYAPDNGEGAN
jgi:hypothetical protein